VSFRSLLAPFVSLWSGDDKVSSGPLPPEVGVRSVSVYHTSLRQVNLLCVFRTPEGVCGGRKIYTSSGRTSLHPACATGSINDETRSRVYKQLREGGELPDLLSGGSGA
jgi:hypothetical protein